MSVGCRQAAHDESSRTALPAPSHYNERFIQFGTVSNEWCDGAGEMFYGMECGSPACQHPTAFDYECERLMSLEVPPAAGT